MKIIIISTSFPIRDDGSEAAGSFVKDFALTLLEQRHEVAVVAHSIEKTSVEPDKSGIQYFWFSVPRLPLSRLSPKKPQDWLPVYKILQQGKKTIDKAVTSFKPDHIFALWALPSGHWARYAKKRYGIPYSIWALGSDIWSLGKVPLVKNYLKQVLFDAHHCFADGYQLAKDVTKISGKHCEFLPSTRQLPVCGLPLTKNQPPYRLCFLGRWHPNKGIDILLEALLLLDDEDWSNIEEVRIAGGGPMEKLVKEQVTRLQEIGKPVTLQGYKDKIGAAELLIWTDFVIIPSRIESIPVIFSDAMQAMRPVIAMPTGDLPRLLNTANCGELVNKIDAGSLALTIKKVLKSNLVIKKEIYLMAEIFRLVSIVDNFIAYI